MEDELVLLLKQQAEDLELAEALRDSDPTAFFKPNAKQEMVCNSGAHEIWVFGGNRAGKTEISIYEFKRMVEGSHATRPLQLRWDGGKWLVWLCSQDGETQRDVLQKKWDRLIPKHWIVKQPSRAGEYIQSILKVPHARFGLVDVEVTWKTYDAKDETFEGASVDVVVCDEEPPKNKYIGIKARLFDSGAWGNGWFSCAMTPVKGEGWTVTDIIEPYREGKLTDTLIVEMSTYDNAENLGGLERVKSFEESLPVDERPARIYGRGLAREGYVMDKFRNELYPNGHLLLPFRPDWSKFMPVEGMDYGYSAPTAFLFFAINEKNQVFQYDEIYVKGMTVPTIKGLIYAKRRQYGYKTPYITWGDPSMARTESSSSKILDHFNSRERNVWVGSGVDPAETHVRQLRTKLHDGRITQEVYGREIAKFYEREGYISYPIPIAKANNKRSEGWEILNESLIFDHRTSQPNLFITSNCIETRREMVRLKWKKTRSGQASSKNDVTGEDHACDVLRYIATAAPKYNPSWYKRIHSTGESRQHVRKY